MEYSVTSITSLLKIDYNNIIYRFFQIVVIFQAVDSTIHMFWL